MFNELFPTPAGTSAEVRKKWNLVAPTLYSHLQDVKIHFVSKDGSLA